MNHFGRRGLIAAVVVTVAVAATVAATALAVTSHSADHNNRTTAAHGQIVTAKPAPVTHHWSIAASGFAPDHIATASGTTDYFNNWDFANLTDNGSRCFNASVHLPNGATIKWVTFYYTDGSTGSFYAELNRQNLAAHKSAELASFNATSGATPTYTHKTLKVLGGGLIDTSRFAYGLGVCPESNAAFSGAIIGYTG
jgi:hypothetical protein